MSHKCDLCGDSYHAGPDTRADQFGLMCPGANASEEDRHAYIQDLAAAYLFLLIDEAEKYANIIGERKRLWDERERTNVTHQELQDHCDEKVAQIAPQQPWLAPLSDEAVKAQLEHEKQSAPLDVDVAHLTVPGPAPTWTTLTKPSKHRAEDALLYMDTREEDG